MRSRAPVAAAMAEGAAKRAETRIGVAVTGIAGPGGGSATKPVGLVCLGWAVKGGETRAHCLQCPGGREDVRRQAVVLALEGLLELLSAPPGKL